MDLLRAINLILPALGEHPVTSVDAKHPTVSLIISNVYNQLNDVLLRGWWFNVYDSTLYPDPEGEVALPLNTLAVLPLDPGCPGIQRNGLLYNKKDLSFKWPVEQGIPVRLKMRLEFEELPEAAAQYVMYNALVSTYLSDIGLEQIVQEWQRSAVLALNTMEAEHLRNQRHSTAKSPRFRRLRRAMGGY